MKKNNNALNVLSNNIRRDIALFAEFGNRGEVVYRGKVLQQNNVTEKEAIFLSRCAKKVAKHCGVAVAYEWAHDQFVKDSYHKLLRRNANSPLTVRQQKIAVNRALHEMAEAAKLATA